MKKLLLLFTALFFSTQALRAQLENSKSSSEIFHELKKLNVVGSVLYIAAHPDDENTRLLAYLANERKLRTGYLSITRGDGGQNLIGKEQAELLGIVRTQELLAARRIDGAEQFFTRANDFGYSKSPEETLEIWNKDSTLYDIVLTIRKFKPDVIICRFPTTGEGGHGHHTASAMLAIEAFEAAADRKVFKDQLKFTDVWQAKSIYWNTYNFGTNNTVRPDQLKLDVGAYNSLLGKSYGEIAAESRSMHKSQGFGSAKQRGSNFEHFKYLKGDSATIDLFENINLSWSRIKGGELIEIYVKNCIDNYKLDSPEKCIPALVQLHKAISELNEKDAETKHWKHLKLVETEKLIQNCAGVWIEALASDYSVVPGGKLNYTIQLLNRSSVLLKINKISFPNGKDTTLGMHLMQNEMYTLKCNEIVNSKLPYSSPYWLEKKPTSGRYQVENKALIGKAENEHPLKIHLEIIVSGLPLQIEKAIYYKSTDPVKGEIYRPLEILPPVTLSLNEKIIISGDTSAKKFLVKVLTNKNDVSMRLKAQASKGWTVSIPNLSDADDVTINDNNQFEVLVKSEQNAENGYLYVFAETGKETFNKTIQRINYDHIPSQFNLVNAEIRLINLAVNKTNTNIAYIHGAGDDVPACLSQIGYSVTILTVEQLKQANLTNYNAIITGIRAYNVIEDLKLQREKLLNYVKLGGNLIVQYNTNSRVGPVESNIGPYPFTISRERITDENATVVFTNPKHSLLNFPNQITQKDFEGWIQERGIYFAKDYDKYYETILSMADPKETALEGSLITCKYGEGNFVYTGLAFFRQLPAGVPGAYKLFANLISLPKNKIDE